MHIGVFGDSFADYCVRNRDVTPWFDIVRQHSYSLVTHAKCASSLNFSFEQFIRNHSKYDKVIFIAAPPGRITIPDHYREFEKSKLDFLQHQMSSLVDFHIKEAPVLKASDEIIAHLHAAKSYFLFLHDDYLEEITRLAQVSYIKQLRPDALILSMVPKETDYLSLMQVSKTEISASNHNHLPPGPFFDKRQCHMSQENNEIFANKIMQWIDTGILHMSLDDFIFPTNVALEDIFIKHE